MAGEESTIGALLDATGGSIKTGPFGTKLKASEYTATGVPVISVGEVGFGRLRVHHDTPRVDGTVSGRMPEFLLKTGDIVFGRKGAVERSAQVQPEEDGYFLGSDGIRIRLNVEECNPKFISYQLLTKAHRNWMIQHAAGTTMPSLNEGIIRRIPIVLKPLAEQKAIAEVLGALDDKIELNRRMNATLEAMARALFQSWFVDFDPVRAKLDGREPTNIDPATAALFPDSFHDSELGPIPTDWEVKTVGDIGNVVCGKTPSTSVSEYYGDEIPFITIPDMHGTVFASATARKLSHAGAQSQANKTLPPGSLCVSCIATPGLVVITSEDSQTNQQINSVVPNQKEETYFWYWVMNGLGDEIASSGSGGSVLVNLSKGRFETLQVIKPPHLLIRTYNNAVRPLFETILANIQQSHTLSTLRDTLLPKLLSGELRVAEVQSGKKATA